jgi:signal transduction histidine kinase
MRNDAHEDRDSESEATTMPPPAGPPAVEKVGIGPLALEHLVDRGALGELAVSFNKLFGIPIRFISEAGVVLAEAGTDPPPPEEALVPIEYDGRVIGRALLGMQPADRLGSASAGADGIQHITEHLRVVLDNILFSGHKALLTSTMHVASIRESYRELTEKNAELSAAYERLKELDRLKSNFLATVSHELRTPLTSIMGYSEMLAEGIGGALSGEQREFVQTIRTKSDQLLGLIMSLLDLSKLESGTMIVRRAEVPITEVLADAATTIAPAASKKGVDLRVLAEEDLPPVLGDSDRLRQVFINLAENAVKFTEAGGEVVLAARSIIEDPDDLPGLVLVAPLRQEVEIRVADTGIGIPESQRAKVFDPFYQIDQSSTREHGGTGLGLSIVKRLIEAHHGSIRIEHNDPRGAVFVVTLPVAVGGPPSSAAPSSHVLQ